MKKVFVVILVVAGAFLVWKFKFSEHAAVKQYKEYRKAYMYKRGFSPDALPSGKWKLDVISFTIEGDKAVIEAEETTHKLPQNAASFTFATIVSRDLDIEMEYDGNRWKVTKEEVVFEEVSTFDDRKNKRD